MTSFNQWLPRLARKGRYSDIGLEIMCEAVNLVQLEHRDGRSCAHAAATLPYSGSRDQLIGDPARLKTLLQPVLRKRFQGRRISSCLPPEYFRLMFVNFRPTDSQSDEDAIITQMRERLDGDLNDYVIDHLPVRHEEGSDEHLSLVAASRRDDVLRYLDCLHSAGLDVQSLEVGPVALNRLLSAIATHEPADNKLSITFGTEKSYLSVHSGRRLLLDREVPFGEQQVVTQICQTMDVDEAFARRLLCKDLCQSSTDGAALSTSPAAALSQILQPLFSRLTGEIDRANVYTASQTRGQSIRQVFLLGSFAHWPITRELLTTLVDIPVEVLYPVSRYQPFQAALNIPDALRDDCLAVGCGLALRGAPS